MKGDPSYLEKISKKIEAVRVQLTVFLFCGFSYLLLYSFFSQEAMPSLLDWQDYDFHVRLIRIFEDQNSYTPFFDGNPVPYPVFFHNIVKIVSSTLNLEFETAMILVSCLVSLGFSFLVFLTITEISKDNLAGLFGTVILGTGANFIIFFSKTIFFGGAFIFPAAYLIAGFLPNLMGHFLGLSMLYVIMKSKLQKINHVVICVFLGTMLILSHLIASITYLIGISCLFYLSHLDNQKIRLRQFGIILCLSIAISSPWWVKIIGAILERPHLLLLSDAGKNWIEFGFLTEMLNFYGFIPIFSSLGLLFLTRISKTSNFLSLWIFMLLPLLFTQWGARFALELAIPLNILGAIGISQTVRWTVYKKDIRLAIRLSIQFFVLAILCDSMRLFDLARNIFTPHLL